MDGQFGMFTFDRRYVKSEHFEQASVGPSVPEPNKGGGSLQLSIASSSSTVWTATGPWIGIGIYKGSVNKAK